MSDYTKEQLESIVYGSNNVKLCRPKCEAFTQMAIEKGYASGMCEECFKLDAVAKYRIKSPIHYA